MWKCVRDLWTDQRGFIVSIEMILIVTIGVLGLIVGLSCLSNAVVAEFQDIGWAVRSLNQSYWFGGFRGCKAFVPGSAFVNRGFPNFGVGAFNEGIVDLGINQGPWGYGVAPGYTVPAVPCETCPPDAPTIEIPCPTNDCPPASTVPGGSVPQVPHLAPPVTPPGAEIPVPQAPVPTAPAPESQPQPVPPRTPR